MLIEFVTKEGDKIHAFSTSDSYPSGPYTNICPRINEKLQFKKTSSTYDKKKGYKNTYNNYVVYDVIHKFGTHTTIEVRVEFVGKSTDWYKPK